MRISGMEQPPWVTKPAMAEEGDTEEQALNTEIKPFPRVVQPRK